MTFRIRVKKDVNEEQMTFQREQSADELNEHQKLKQILTEKFENWENISRSDDEDIATSSNDNVDYVKLVAKKRKKTKNLKVKKEYFILQKRNRRLRKFLWNDEIKTQLTQRCRTIEINENFLIKISKLKRQRLIIDLKFANLNIYYDKSFKKFKDWTRSVLNAFKINFLYFFFQNELKSVEFSSSFATRRRSAEITKKRIWKLYKNVKIKKLLELFNRFYEKFAKSTFYCCIKAWCNEIELITECKRLRCVCRSFKNRSRRIYFDSAKKSSS